MVHVTRAEFLQLLEGCRRLDWRDEYLLAGISAWLCTGRRHGELLPGEVACVLRDFAALGYATPLLRAALEHALLRVAGVLDPADCVMALSGAVDVGMGVRSEAVRSLLRRCTAQLALIPAADTFTLLALSSSVRHIAEQEVVAAFEDGPASRAAAAQVSPPRLPLELHLFGEAVASQHGVPPSSSSGNVVI